MAERSRSTQAQEYRSLYNLAAWRGPNGRRALQLRRQPLCESCLAQSRTTQATVADHIIPHRGDRTLFLTGKLQSLCDEEPWRCHSKVKQSEEARGYSTAIGEDGFALDPMHPSNRTR